MRHAESQRMLLLLFFHFTDYTLRAVPFGIKVFNYKSI